MSLPFNCRGQLRLFRVPAETGRTEFAAIGIVGDHGNSASGAAISFSVRYQRTVGSSLLSPVAAAANAVMGRQVTVYVAEISHPKARCMNSNE